MRALWIWSLAAWLPAGAAFGQRTLRVPSAYKTIAAAMAAARSGDTILVAAGTYSETVDYAGKDVVLRSESGPSKTAIRGYIYLRNGETAKAVLEGFQITAPWTKNAVLVSGASPTLRGNRFSGPNPSHALNLVNSSARVLDCEFASQGKTWVSGSGSPEFARCSFHGVGGTALVLSGANSTYVHDCVFRGNGRCLHVGSGARGTSVRVENCLFADNNAGNVNGGVFRIESGCRARIAGCRFVGNRALRATLVTSWGALEFTRNYAWGNLTGKAHNSSLIEVEWADAVLTDNFIGEPAGTFGTAFVHRFNSAVKRTYGHNGTYGIESAYYNAGSRQYPKVLMDSIFWGGAGYGRWPYFGYFVSSAYCDIGPTGFRPGTGNYSANPLFVDPLNGDFHLKAKSPCIDKPTGGTAAAIDLDGTPRDKKPDTGPYEFAAHNHWFLGRTHSGGAFRVTFQAGAGDHCFLVVAGARRAQPVPTPFGPFHLAGPLLILYAGRADAEGLLKLGLTAPAVPAPVVLPTQAFVGAGSTWFLTGPKDLLLGG